ncbi:MAG: hypothetical protein IID45_01570 [Planctomycetes bacterium]|nr:hypothetical protein [Planctomycetota bacterium]
MRIQPSRKAKSYLKTKDQKRMLALVALLALILIVSRMAANPDSWNWFFALGTQPENGKTANQRSADKSRPPGSPTSPRLKVVTKKKSRKRDSRPKAASSKTPQPKTIANPTVRLDPALFERVEDRSDDIQDEERAAFVEVLENVVAVPPQDLRKAVQKDVPFSVLVDQPERYRGAIFTIEGNLYKLKRRDETIRVRKGPGKKTVQVPLFDAWILTAESEKTPFHVVIAELPHAFKDLKQERDFDPPRRVKVTGYFFKVHRYVNTKDYYHFAPMLLAKDLRLVREADSFNRSREFAPYVIGFIFCIVAVMGLAMWRFSSGDKSFQKEHLHRLAEPATPDIAALDRLPVIDTNDLFSNLDDSAKVVPTQQPEKKTDP